ncbi:MAG: SH3 domain-containing protein, partial [Parasporobacterium sp.]|nr:SH3 domain-containing protein [Parasporobacterium sp.]
MKTLKKTLLGITAAGLAGAMVLTTAFAAEAPAPAPAETTAAAKQEGKTFVTSDGVFSIFIPEDGDNWMAIDDPNTWFTLGDGRDLITVKHLVNGGQLPKTETANDRFEEVYQMFYSTPNEVFVITGSIADKEEAAAIREAVCSFKVLQYDTIKKPEQPTSAYAIRELNEIRYCTEKDGVNVRSGFTTDDPLLGGFHFGDQVTVTGAVTKDGVDNGWIRVNYNGQTGY